MSDCKTPGANYTTIFQPELVGILVDLPHQLDISVEDMQELENKLHDAVEEILAPYFEKEECEHDFYSNKDWRDAAGKWHNEMICKKCRVVDIT